MSNLGDNIARMGMPTCFSLARFAFGQKGACNVIHENPQARLSRIGCFHNVIMAYIPLVVTGDFGQPISQLPICSPTKFAIYTLNSFLSSVVCTKKCWEKLTKSVRELYPHLYGAGSVVCIPMNLPSTTREQSSIPRMLIAPVENKHS